jgi:hypothetical protein
VKECYLEECHRRAYRKDLCRSHYYANSSRRCTLCDNGHFAKGLCQLHYQRQLHQGDPLTQGQLRYYGTDEERFWLRVNKNGCVVNELLGHCWEWTGSTDKYGYGQFKSESGMVKCHRHIFKLLNIALDNSLTLDHLCRVKHCVNPSHLEEVTRRENILRYLQDRNYD